MVHFKDFLLREAAHYLGQKSGDVLNALQNLRDDAATMGNRSLIRACQGIVNQIRRILHGHWENEDVQYLKKLQKIGVAMMKAIDENEDMQEIIASAVAEMEGMLDKLQTPINSLGTEDAPETEVEPLQQGSEMGA